MSNLSRRLSRRAIQRPAAKKALARIHDELWTLVNCGPNFGYDIETEQKKAKEAIHETLDKIRRLYR